MINNKDKEDWKHQENRIADRSTPKFRMQQYYRDKYTEALVGPNDKTRIDVPSKSTNHLKNAIQVLDLVVKDLKSLDECNIKYNLKVMSFRQIITCANHDLRTLMENELRNYTPKVKRSRHTTYSG